MKNKIMNIITLIYFENSFTFYFIVKWVPYYFELVFMMKNEVQLKDTLL